MSDKIRRLNDSRVLILHLIDRDSNEPVRAPKDADLEALGLVDVGLAMTARQLEEEMGKARHAYGDLFAQAEPMRRFVNAFGVYWRVKNDDNLFPAFLMEAWKEADDARVAEDPDRSKDCLPASKYDKVPSLSFEEGTCQKFYSDLVARVKELHATNRVAYIGWGLVLADGTRIQADICTHGSMATMHWLLSAHQSFVAVCESHVERVGRDKVPVCILDGLEKLRHASKMGEAFRLTDPVGYVSRYWMSTTPPIGECFVRPAPDDTFAIPVYLSPPAHGQAEASLCAQIEHQRQNFRVVEEQSVRYKEERDAARKIAADCGEHIDIERDRLTRMVCQNPTSCTPMPLTKAVDETIKLVEELRWQKKHAEGRVKELEDVVNQLHVTRNQDTGDVERGRLAALDDIHSKNVAELERVNALRGVLESDCKAAREELSKYVASVKAFDDWMRSEISMDKICEARTALDVPAVMCATCEEPDKPAACRGCGGDEEAPRMVGPEGYGSMAVGDALYCLRKERDELRIKLELAERALSNWEVWRHVISVLQQWVATPSYETDELHLKSVYRIVHNARICDDCEHNKAIVGIRCDDEDCLGMMPHPRYLRKIGKRK